MNTDLLLTALETKVATITTYYQGFPITEDLKTRMKTDLVNAIYQFCHQVSSTAPRPPLTFAFMVEKVPGLGHRLSVEIEILHPVTAEPISISDWADEYEYGVLQ